MIKRIVNIILKITIGLVILIGIIFLIGIYMLKHSPKNNIRFDITTQKIISSRPLWTLYISNDSSQKGFHGIIEWRGEMQPPYEIDIKNVDSGYYYFDTNKKIERIDLDPNSKFIVKPRGHGAITTIEIWTDSVGHVYKTIIDSPVEK